MNRTQLITLAAVLTGAGAIFVGSQPGAASPESEGELPVEPKVVRASQVESAEGRRIQRYSGVVAADRTATLSFTIPGRVAERRVDVGDRVEAGTVVAVLDRKPLRNQVAAAQASVTALGAELDQLERDEGRLKRLADSESISTVQWERTSASRKSLASSREGSKVALSEARRVLTEAVLKAPFGGTVERVEVEEGEYATPGRPVITVSGDGPLELQVEVPETVIVGIAVGDAVDVELPLAGGRRVAGRVVGLANGVGRRGSLFPVRVALETRERMLPGMTAELVVETEFDQQLAVPADAVINPGGQDASVFVVREGVARRVAVEVAGAVEGKALVSGALQEGETVVTGGHGGLVPGLTVEVR